MLHRLWTLLLLFCVSPTMAFGGSESWDIQVSVVADTRVQPDAIKVRSLSVDPYSVSLESDGDGRWSGLLEIDPARMLHLELWVTHDGRHARAFSSVEPLAFGDQDMDWLLTGPVFQAQRVSQASTRSELGLREAARVGFGLGWILLVAGAIGWSVRRRPGPRAIRWKPGPLQSLGLWLGLAAAWTWPAAIVQGDRMVGRFFDAIGTVWSIDAAPRLFLGWRDWMTGWPLGIDLHRFDSFSLVPIGWLFGAADPVQIHGLLMVFGVGVSAWAAQGFAGAVGARAPWTLLAGLGFGFSGLAANALIEGHVYHVLNSWLPLFGWSLWRALHPGGRSLHGIAAGLLFGLCLATTGYLGVAALLMGAGLALGGRVQIRANPRPLIVAALVGFVCGGLYVWIYLSGAPAAAAVLSELSPTSAHLSSLSAATPELDRTQHALAPIISGWMLGLVCLAPIVLPAQVRWRALMGTCLAALLLSMAPTFSLDAGTPLLPVSFVGLQDTGLGAIARFPARFSWVWALLGGVLAARVATELAPKWGRWGWVVLGVALIEAFVVVGLPARQVLRPTGLIDIAPPAIQGPVLDLFPQSVVEADRMDLWLGALACLDQTRHRQPIAHDCVGTGVVGSTERIRHWVVSRLFEGRVDRVEQGLRDLGFQWIALREGVFAPGDRSRLVWALRAMDAAPSTRGRGGDAVRVYRIPEGSRDLAVADRLKAMAGARADNIVGTGQSLLVRAGTVRLGIFRAQAARGPGAHSGALVARVKDGMGDTVEVALTDDGSVPGDSAMDGLAWGRLQDPRPGLLQVQLVEYAPGGVRNLWSGSILPTVVNDSFVWQRAEGTTSPIAALPGTASPGVQPWNGRVALLGWGVIVLVGFGLTRRARAHNKA
jgi:hypothetical protein